MTLGKNIKRIRKNKKMTIKDVAEKTHLTMSLISQIENDKANPSINSLKAIAKALNVPIVMFFDYNGEMSSPVVKRDERRILKTQSGFTMYLLTRNVKDRNLEFLYNVYEKGGSTGELYTHEGEECGIVLEGRLEVTIEDQTYILEAGDSISLDSTKPHKCTNVYDGQTIAIWVNSQVSF